MAQWKLVAQKELVALCKNWWLSIGTDGSVEACSSEETGGSLQELVALYWNWWLSIGTDDSVEASSSEGTGGSLH
jgi:hypothetical protein